MLRLASWSLAFAAFAPAGVISGVVLDYGSGRALARTSVTLDPLPGSAGLRSVTVRSGRSGHFSFDGLPAGMYRLYAQRRGFATTFHGQRRPEGQGVPVEVKVDSNLFAELRLRRMGAITGSVLDENGVGIPGATVVAYRTRLPLRPAATGVADDRGVYRLGGLQSGRYWVRSASHTLEDGSGRVPTFGPQTHAVREARVHDVRFDGEAIGADVYPSEGSLYSVSGEITCHLPGPLRVQVTLSSETGRQTQQSACEGGYSFQGLASGEYELLATYVGNAGAAFAEFSLQRNLPMPLVLHPPVSVDFDAPSGAKLSARRSDLAGPGEFREMPLPRAALEPGYWEFRADLPDGQYVQDIRASTGGGRRSRRPDRVYEVFDVFLEPRFGQRVRVIAGDKAAEIAGSVKSAGHVVPGAPVFLWPVGEDTRRQTSGWRMAISDTAGTFQFPNLPPGEYRVLATFDASEAGGELMEEAEAVTIRLEPGQKAGLDARLWLAP